MSQSALRGIYLRLTGVLMLVVVLALGANAWVSHDVFERSLTPAVSKKVAIIGASVSTLVLKAVEQGVPFKHLYGVDQKFAEIKKDMPEVASFAITDTQGKVLYEGLKAPAGAAEYFASPGVLQMLTDPQALPPTVHLADQFMVSLPIVASSGPLGMLHIGIGVHFVDDIVIGMTYDVIVILVVALFFTLELLHFLAGERLARSLNALGDAIDRGIEGRFVRHAGEARHADFAAITRALHAMLERVNAGFEALARDVDAARRLPSHERPPALAAVQAELQQLARRWRFGDAAPEDVVLENQIGKVRTPLFIFILAEELTRSFLPTYVKSLLVPIPWLSPQIAIGLPIAVFMLIVALAQPHLGAYSERVGHRRTMLIGAAVAGIGFVATAFAATVLDLLVWRSLCAIGYAAVFVAGQGYVLEHASPGARARSFAVFIGAIMVATICGPSIGGILADNIGVRPTFGFSALLAFGSMLAMRGLPVARTVDPARQASRAPSPREILALLFNPRFMSVTALAAMPAKIVLTGICFYLVPLYMQSIGGSQAMTGRLLMSYAVVMVLMGPLTATLANTRERMEWLVGGGLLLSGLGGALLLVGSDAIWVFVSIVIIGFGQSLSISAQSALVSEHCAAEVARMGESAVYGVYRLLERIGNALGPLIAGTLVLNFGYRTSFAAIGALAVGCASAFLLSTMRSRAVVLASA